MTTVIPPAPTDPQTHEVVLADDFDAYAAAWQARDAAEQARIKELENPPTPVPAEAVMWGINASTKAQHDLQLAQFGPEPLSWRYYQNPGEPIAAPKEYTPAKGSLFVYSDKVLPHQKKVADVVALMKALPPNSVYSPWHEFEDDLESGHFTLAQLAQGFAIARQAQQQSGRNDIFIAVILMGYSWLPASKRNVETYLAAIGDQNYDLITSDTYFAGPIGGPISGIPTAFDAQLATAAKHGKTWGVTETGVGHKVSGQERIDALKLLAQTIKKKLLGQPVKKGPLLGMYFVVPNSSGAPGAWDLNDAEAAAWHEGQK